MRTIPILSGGSILVRILVCVALFAARLNAQVIPSEGASKKDQWVFGGSLFGGIPMGEFRQHENGGGGGQLMLGFQPWRRQPLVLRGQFGALLYGVAQAQGYQDVCDTSGCYTELVNYNARNHTMMMLHGGPELMATDGKWRPYAYALAGGTFFRSWANTKPETPTGGTEESETLFSSKNFSTTYALGIRRVGGGGGREGAFDLAVRFTRNATASYLTEDGLHKLPDGRWQVSPRYGAANVLTIEVGFWIGPAVRWFERGGT